MSKKFYRCENEFGSDPCGHAQNDYKIPEDEVIPAMDGGDPKCPGTTLSGKDCGAKLVGPYSAGGKLPKKALLAVLAVVVVSAAVIWLLIGTGDAPESDDPQIQVNPIPLTFPKKDSGTVTADLRIRNSGKGELIIERIEAAPSAFSVSEDKMNIDEGEAGTLSVSFEPPSAERIEGTLMIHSNAPDSPTTVSLFANHDPWWVYNKLDTTSKILTEP